MNLTELTILQLAQAAPHQATAKAVAEEIDRRLRLAYKKGYESAVQQETGANARGEGG